MNSETQTVFRPYQPGDHGAIATMLRRANMYDARRANAEYLASVTSIRDTAALVGEVSDGDRAKVVAFALLGDVLPILSNLVVDEQYRGRGIGTQMIDYTEGIARDMGHRYLEIVVDEELASFYRDRGFHATGRYMLMERPIGNTLHIPTQQKQHAEVDTSTKYASIVYNQAFSTIVRACLEIPNYPFRQPDPRIISKQGKYVARAPYPSPARPKQIEGTARALGLTSTSGLPEYAGLWGWALLSSKDPAGGSAGFDVIKPLCRSHYKDLHVPEVMIWDQEPVTHNITGIYFIRPQVHDASTPIHAIRPNSHNRITPDSSGWLTIKSTPERFNILVAAAQTIMLNELAA